MLAPGSGAQGDGPALLLRGIRKAYAEVKAVDGLDLEVARGECFGLLGPNGAGKTTTIEICEGLTAPDDGTVEVLGLNWRAGADELRQRIGIQLQETQFPDKLTVEETLRLFRSFFKRGIPVEESVQTAQLEEKRGSRWEGSRAVRSSGWRWRQRWWATRSCCFWTSRRRASIRRRGGTCGSWWTG
jgi:ABC-2 type transport system ATP-binding protein